MIDDVFTTGATIREAVSELWTADPAEIDVLTLARTVEHLKNCETFTIHNTYYMNVHVRIGLNCAVTPLAHLARCETWLKTTLKNYCSTTMVIQSCGRRGETFAFK